MLFKFCHHINELLTDDPKCAYMFQWPRTLTTDHQNLIIPPLRSGKGLYSRWHGAYENEDQPENPMPPAMAVGGATA